MKKILLLVACFCIQKSVFSQLYIDSIKKSITSEESYGKRIKSMLTVLDYYETKNFDSTITYGKKALNLARNNADSASVANIKRHIGVAYYFKGDYNIAAKFFYESIYILERNNDKKNLAPAYNELAKFYRRTKEYKKAIETYNQASVIYRSLNDTSGMAMILNESGVVYEYLENYEEAFNRYKISLQLATLIGDSLSVSYSLSNIAGIYVTQQQYAKAEDNLLRALKIRKILKDSFSIAITYSDLGSVKWKQGDYKKSSDYFFESNRLAEKLKYSELQLNNYNELSEAAKKQGDYKSALNFYITATKLHDSLYTVEKNKQIESLNAQYEASKKEQKILEQTGKIQLHNYIFIGFVIFILLSALLIFLLYRRYKLTQENKLQTMVMQQQQLAAISVMEAEENERRRIATDLHDGIGQMMSVAKMNLSSMQTEINFHDIQQQKFDKIISLVDDSCKEIRNISHNMMPSALDDGLSAAVKSFLYNLDDKLLVINSYFDLQNESIDKTIQVVLYRAIQETVNNVIKHAHATNLNISAIQDTDNIHITIEDNGKGFNTDSIKSADGIGLQNIKSRISFLKGTVEWDSKEGRGTTVVMNIPVIK